MEKRKAHYDLVAIKALVAMQGMDTFTRTAKTNARLMGLDEAMTLQVIAGLQPRMLFKSMTTHTDTSVWQDVYHAPCPNGKTAYIKLTLRANSVVIQFKDQAE